MENYLQGLIMGFAYVAPIGLQNLFVINAALTQKKSRAFATAFIVIFFDISLAFACFFGIGALMEHFQWLEMIVLLLGSLIVIWIGVGLIRRKEEEKVRAHTSLPLTRVMTAACAVTWLNPQAIIDGTMMLGAFRVILPAAEGTKFIAGVGSASLLWFLGITAVILLFQNRFSFRVLLLINRICGAVVIFYGLKLLWSFLQLAGGLL